MIYIQELILLNINRSLSLSPSANSVDNWSPSLIDKPSAVCVLNALIHLRVHQLSKINRISNALNMILNQHLFKARTQSEINETGLAAAAFVFQPMLLTLTDNGGTCLLPMFTFSKAFGGGRWLNKLRDLGKKRLLLLLQMSILRQLLKNVWAVY